MVNNSPEEIRLPAGAEIYPLPGDILTEMEKDKAMERYRKKVNHRIEPVKYADHLPDKVELQFSHEEAKKPEKPEISKNPLQFLILSGCSLVWFLALAVFATPFCRIGVLLRGSALVFTCIQFKNFRARKKEYDRWMRVYEHDME